MGIWSSDNDDPEIDFRVRHLTVGIWFGFGIDVLSIGRLLSPLPTHRQLWFIPIQILGLFLPLLLRLPLRRIAATSHVPLGIALGSGATCAVESAYVMAGGHGAATYPITAMIMMLYVCVALPVPGVLAFGLLGALGEGGVTAVEGQPYRGAAIEITILMVAFAGLATLLAHNREAQRRLQRQAGQRAASLAVHASDMVIAVGPEGLIACQSLSTERVLGYLPDELIGQSSSVLCHPADVFALREWFRRMSVKTPDSSERIDARMLRADGEWCYVEIVGSNQLADPEVTALVLGIRDISDRKALEGQLSHQAFHDPLTGLANRALFRDRVRHAVTRQAHSGDPIGLFMIDLDDFKLVNDGLGHSAGDELLTIMADRIKAEVRSSDTVARLGGDEFGILIEDDATEAEAAGLAARLIDALRSPVNLIGQDAYVGASIGIAICTLDLEDPGSTATVDELMRNADVAMYVSKGTGKNSYTVFDPSMYNDLLLEAQQRVELEQAFMTDQFVVHYQPIVELPTGRVTGSEALVRWNHPTKGLLPPDTFIPLAEATGLIVQLGRWVLQEACRQTRRWQLEIPGAARMRISVNLSPRQFQSASLVADVDQAIRSSGIDPRTVGLEITESMLMSDTNATILTLTQLKALGVQLSVDDFGTGYSSLGYLKRFPVDILKIDKSFIDDIATNADDASLARTIVDLGRTLHMQTVAEGIESSAQFQQLQDLGCDFGQGFLFARPVSPDQVRDLLMNHMAAEADDVEAGLTA